MQTLLEETQRNIVDLVKAWRNGSVQQRQELAFSRYPDGWCSALKPSSLNHVTSC
jgi:hypothetical protein